MVTDRKSRRRRRKKIVRSDDGSLFDASERRGITTAELRDYVREGGLFEARRQGSGSDCTYEVLQSVLGSGMPANLVPGLGGPLTGLGGLSGVSGGGGPLAALGGLGDLTPLSTDAVGRSRGRDWEDSEERPRRSGRHSLDDRNWAEGDWAETPRRSELRDGEDWAADPESD